MRARAFLASSFILLASITCHGQGIISPRAAAKQDARPGSAASLPAALPVSAIKIDARIDNQVAKVKVEHLFRNDTDQELEGTFYFPVPKGATLIEFAVYNGDERRVGRVKEKEEAQASYTAAASQGEDPALLEMTRRGWFQSRVYPIPPRSEKRIEIIYSHIISAEGGVYTFDYPLGQGYKKLRVPVGEVEIRIDLGSDVAIKNVFSPTHPLDLSFDGDCHVTGKLSTPGGGEAENFKLVYSLTSEAKESVTAQDRGYNTGGGDPQVKTNTLAEFVQRQMNQLSFNGRGFDRLLAQLAPGTVVDQTGAVIPGATVTIKDQNTGATRTVTTDSKGIYSVVGLPPGNYRIEVDAPGFKKTQIENVVVQPGQVSSTGVQLSPGAVAEAVSVFAVATAVDTSAPHTSSNYESRKLRDLPSLAPVESFARLAPGMTSREANEINKQTGTGDKNSEFRFWFNGRRARSNNFTLDGQDNNDIDGRPSLSMNNFDSVESLHIVTTRSGGDVGLTGASSINLLTRAGTNEFHGTVFDYHLNRRLGALSPLERRSGLDRAPEFKNTIYGGTIGGPLWRDRAFFFGAFQGESERSLHFVDSTSSQLTPTLSGLQELARLFPSSAAVSDLISRGPLARAVGNPQVSRTFLLPVGDSFVEFGQITRIPRSSTEGYEAGARFDFNLTRRDTLEAGYWYDDRSASNIVGRLASGYPGGTDVRAQVGSLRWNRLLSPYSSNELLLGFNRARLSLDPEPATSSGVEELPAGPGVVAGFRWLAYGNSPFATSSHASTLFEASDVLAIVMGRHNIKLGGQVRRRLTRFDYLPGRDGQYYYAGFEDFLLDRPSAFSVAIGDPRSDFEQTHQHYFIDDAWRLRRNLTLSLGLSYENVSQPLNGLAERVRARESNPATALFDTSLPLEARAIAPVERDNNNFAPRIGFAYTPHLLVFGKNIFGYDRTVIRGGASISYDQTAYRPLAETAASSPNILLAAITPSSGFTLPAFPNVPSRSELLSIIGGDASRFARTGLSREYRTPISSSWHLTVTRNLDEKLIIETSYIGSRGVGLVRAIDANPAAGAGPLRVYETTGRSIYHSLQLKGDVRLTEQFSGGVAYTLSKLIDDVPDNSADISGGVGDAATFGVSGLQGLAQNPFDSSRGERSLSSFDRRHTLAAHFLYSLPIARLQSGALGRLLGGWKGSGIISLATGSPFTPLQYIGRGTTFPAIFAAQFSDRLGAVRPFIGNPIAPIDAVAFSNAANAFYRFYLSADGTPITSPTGFIIADRNGIRAGNVEQARFVYNDYSVEQAARAMGLAPDAFGATYAAGREFGDAGRNMLTGPRLVNVDFALLKTTKLSEKVSLQFRAEFFNLFNHPNRARPNSILENAGGFGFADQGETDATPRRVRLALKLIF